MDRLVTVLQRPDGVAGAAVPRESPRVAIRVDASIDVGSGHVMRCLALADELAAASMRVTFLCMQLPDVLAEVVRIRGHEVLLLRGRAPNARGGVSTEYDWLSDAQLTLSALSLDGPWHCLVVDHYQLDSRWESMLRLAVGRLLVIDDLANRRHACDFLLDQNLDSDGTGAYQGLLNPACKRLFGPRFALLNREFRQQRLATNLARSRCRRVLVFIGGMDAANLTQPVLEVVSRTLAASIGVDVVVGGANPHRDQIEALCARHPGWRFYCQTDRMAELFANADLAIGAAGSASWERCCLGLPAIVFTVAENQNFVARTLLRRRAAIGMGIPSGDWMSRLSKLLPDLVARPRLLARVGVRAASLVDGLGARRVALSMLGRSALQLHNAKMTDAESAYAWRSDPQTREASLDVGPFSLESHLAWWRAALESPLRVLLMGVVGQVPVGVVRFDLDGSSATISIYLNPDLRGIGLGPALITASLNWLCINRPDVKRVDAKIKASNAASKKVFGEAGFLQVGSVHVWSRPMGNAGGDKKNSSGQHLSEE